MPHWTLTPEGHDGSTAQTAQAVSALQAELDKVLDDPGAMNAGQLDAIEKQVETFYADFRKHVEAARARIE